MELNADTMKINKSRSGWYERDKMISPFKMSTLKFKLCYVSDVFLKPV